MKLLRIVAWMHAGLTVMMMPKIKCFFLCLVITLVVLCKSIASVF